MEPTHFLYLIENPRKDFAATMTDAESEVFGRHASYYREHAKKGLVLMAGPALDDTYGICVLATVDFEVADAFRAGDPVVKEGLMKGVLHPWRASIGSLIEPPATIATGRIA
jgi:uncharacterized protein YciI